MFSNNSLGLVSDLGTNKPDNLIVGVEVTPQTQAILLLTGQGELARGSVIGIAAYEIGDVTIGGSNVGDGTLTGEAIGIASVIGDYIVTCITEVVNAGVFSVFNPNGVRLEDATVGVAYSNNEIAFTLTDGTEDFDVADVFTIAVDAVDKGVLCDKNAIDGSQIANLILAETIDTTSADIVATTYKTGVFNRDLLVFGTNGAPDTYEQDLRDVGIHVKDRAPY